MDFFARQDASRRSTKWLVILFGLAFTTVAIATAVVVGLAVGAVDPGNGFLSTTASGRWQFAPRAPLVGAIAAATLGLMIIASLYRSATLSKGGGQVAKMLGGTQVNGDEADSVQRRLLNVVEEMAIASGLPVPEVYVLEQEAGINAFAAGLGHADAAIAVTRGSLEQLTRAELRGVIAHEFSHILNGDMRLNVRLMGLGYGILVLSLIGRWLLRGARFSRSSRNRGGGAIIAVGVGLAVVGGIGVVLSRLIKAAVSRQREVLADASAVQFTREPLALAGALKKIGGFTPYLTTTETEEVSHMLFGRGAPSFRGWFATHPPLPERIRSLDPSFQEGDYPAPVAPELSAQGNRPDQLSVGLTDSPSLDMVTVAAAGSIRDDSTGSVLHRSIPESLHTAAHSVEDSLLLIVAVALAADAAIAEQQTALVRGQLGELRAARSLAFSRELRQIDRRLWLPLVEIAVPALKRRPATQIEFLLDLLTRLAASDAQQSLFEYVLFRLLSAYLIQPQRPGRAAGGFANAAVTVIATVAAFGHRDRSAARAAVDAGLVSLLPNSSDDTRPIVDEIIGKPQLHRLDPALELLAAAPAKQKQNVLEALEITIRHDGAISIEEAELLRAVGAAIGCPIPPARALS